MAAAFSTTQPLHLLNSSGVYEKLMSMMHTGQRSEWSFGVLPKEASTEVNSAVCLKGPHCPFWLQVIFRPTATHELMKKGLAGICSGDPGRGDPPLSQVILILNSKLLKTRLRSLCNNPMRHLVSPHSTMRQESQTSEILHQSPQKLQRWDGSLPNSAGKELICRQLGLSWGRRVGREATGSWQAPWTCCHLWGRCHLWGHWLWDALTQPETHSRRQHQQKCNPVGPAPQHSLSYSPMSRGSGLELPGPDQPGHSPTPPWGLGAYFLPCEHCGKQSMRRMQDSTGVARESECTARVEAQQRPLHSMSWEWGSIRQTLKGLAGAKHLKTLRMSRGVKYKLLSSYQPRNLGKMVIHREGMG